MKKSTTLALLLATALCADATAAGLFEPASPWMLGDWNGTRSELADAGYDFTLKYVGELGSNLSGGYDKSVTARWSDQLILGLDMDLQKIANLPDAQLRIGIGERHGKDITNDRLHHPDATGMTSTMEVFGGGNAWRLSQLWYEQRFLDRRLAIKLGRFGHGEDFDQFPCEFQNVTLCGSQEGNWNGTWNSFPISQWAIRARYQLTPELFIQAGAYDRNPGNAKPGNGFKPFISGSQGTTFPFEVVWKGRLNDLAAEYHAGYYYGNLDTQDTYKDAQGNPAALTGEPYRKHTSIDGWWLSAQQQLTRADGHPDRGLHAFANVTHNDPSSNMIGNLLQAGLIYRGPTAFRPKDTIGIGVSRFQVNTDFRRNAQLINTLNQVTHIRDPRYVPVQDREYSFEVNYGYQATGWLMLRPNLQYVRYPGGMREVDDAAVLGLQVITDF